MSTEMKQFQFVIRSLADTDRLGAALAETLPPGTTVALCGTLGAGKTRLVQAIAAACGIPREAVVSPTFVLCQEYYGNRTLYHCDAYRLETLDEFRQLGPEEWFQSEGITLIEWADRVAPCLPSERLEVLLELADSEDRRVTCVAVGETLEPVVQALEKRLGTPAGPGGSSRQPR
jgi:tRNA threonylcarbamoyladenosine biosynthesis protein TsaE